jgi:DNA-binding MarR family transcriptional regulator
MAEAVANDPKMLHKRIRDLEGELARGPTGNDERSYEEGRRKGFEQGHKVATAAIAGKVRGVIDTSNAFLAELADVAQSAKNFGTAIDVLDAVLKEPLPVEIPVATGANGQSSAPAAPKTPLTLTRKSPPAPRSIPDSELGKGEHVVLTAIAQYGDAGVDVGQLYVLTGYKSRSITDYVSRLRTAGYVAPGWPARATQDGIDALGSTFEPLPTGDRLREHWLARLTGGEHNLLTVLCDSYPSGIDNAELGRLTRYAARSVSDYIGRLKARRLVDRRGQMVYASEMLFGR